MKKVLLIAFYFDKTDEIASKRLRGLAKYLPQVNWEPIILTPKSNNNIINNNINPNIIETEYEYMLDKWKNKLKLIYKNKPKKLNYYNLQNTEIKNKKTDNNNLNNKLISIAGEIFAYPDGMKYWYKPAIKTATKIIRNKDIKGIISSSWPITSHIIARDLKKQFNIPWIADLRDLWNKNPYISHNFIRRYFEKRLEINTFKYADALTTTTKSSASLLKELHPNNKIYSIVSGFDPDEFSDIPIKNKPTKILNFTYTGSLYNGKRDPTFLFKGISQLIEENKIDPSKIALNFYGDNNRSLEEIANKYNINNMLNIHGQIPHREALIKQKESEILLLISWNNKKEKIFIPGKIYEYFTAKRPILSIGYKEGSLKDLIEETNCGVHVSTLDEVKMAFMKFYNEFVENKTVYYNGNNKINEYSMLNTAKNFGKILDSIYH